MRRPLIVLTLIAVTLLGVAINRALPASAKPPAPIAPGPLCAFVCDKTGINTGFAERSPQAEYLHAQQLGMGWDLEIAGSMYDVNRTAEGINRARAHGLQAIVRICVGDTCDLGTPALYSEFLHAVAQQVDGDFWALMGPNEPDLEHWAGDAVGVADFMNGTLDLVGDIPNLKKLSPAFNLTNRATPLLIQTMESAGARFADLDGFAGTSYNLGGSPAYGYYAHNGGESMRQKALRFGKPFIFIETGTFAMLGHDSPDDPRRARVVTTLRKDFGLMAQDPTVIGILYFNAFGDNTGMPWHVLYDPELIAISENANCTGSGFNPAGVGISTSETLWQTSGDPACHTVQAGCPFVGGSVCSAGLCVDNDHDGLPGDGMGCTRTDCNDSNPAMGTNCSAGADDQQARWGTLKVVDAGVPAPQAWPVIRLGADHLPIIGYESGKPSQGDLTFLQCTSDDCSTALRRVLVADNDSGSGISMQVRSDGRPILAYLNRTDYYLETYNCADQACASGNVNVGDTAIGQYGIETSLALSSAPDGFPRIAYWSSGVGGNLGLVSCDNADCSSSSAFNLDTKKGSGVAPTIFTNLDGATSIVYTRANLNRILMLTCSDAQCSSGTQAVACSGTTAPCLIPNAASLPTSAVTLDSAGRPLIVYRHLVSGGEALALFACADAACSSGASSDLYTTSGHVPNASITLLPDGNPFIVFSELVSPGDYNLGVLYCQDPACSATSLDQVTDGDAGEHPDVVVRDGGNPLVVYHDVGNGRLMVYDVDMSLVTGTPQEPGVPTATPTPDDTQPTPTATSIPLGSLVPIPPVLISPINNVIVRGMPTFSWKRVDRDTAADQFEYAAGFDFSSPLFTSDDLIKTKFVPPSMDKGTYFWHVRSRNTAGVWSDWSVPRMVVVKPVLPGKISKLLLPLNGATVPAGMVDLSWNMSLGADSYEIWLGLTSPVITPTLTATSPTAAVTVGPLDPGTYFWQVRGLNSDGEPGPWSKTYRLVVN